MGYEAEFQIAFHGQTHILQRLPETVAQWIKSDLSEYEDEDGALEELEKLVRKKGKGLNDKPGQQMGVLCLDYLYTSNAVGVLACLNGVKQVYPELEVAVAAQLDSTPFSFYSAVGEHEVCKEIKEWKDYPDFAQACFSSLQVSVYGERAGGEGFYFDLMDVTDIGEMPFGENGLLFSDFGEAEVLFDEGIPLLLRNDTKGLWSYVIPADDFEDRYEMCLVRREEGGLTSIFQALILSSHTKSFSWEDSSKALWEGLHQLYPEIRFTVELSNGTPNISDEEGNTYYMGGMLHIGELAEKTKWRFPPQADWIPFV